jgi:hypothetical protein
MLWDWARTGAPDANEFREIVRDVSGFSGFGALLHSLCNFRCTGGAISLARTCTTTYKSATISI